MSVYKPYKNKVYEDYEPEEKNKKILLAELKSRFIDFSSVSSIKEEFKNFDISVVKQLSLALTGTDRLNTSDIAEKIFEIGHDEFYARLQTYLDTSENPELVNLSTNPGIFYGNMREYISRLGRLSKQWGPEVIYPTFSQLIRNAGKVVITIIVFGICCVLVDSVYEIVLKRVFGIVIKHTGALTMFDEIL